MPGRRRAAVPGAAPPVASRLGNEFGWRAHEAIQGWTASVDAKASIALVVQTALAGAGAHALIAGDGELHHATGLRLVLAIAAVAFLVASVVCGLWVIFPRLHRRRRDPPAGLIYFGDLRDRDPDEIAATLGTLTPEQERAQLACQMRVTSRVAWRKHSWLQRSLGAFMIGAILLVLTYVTF